MSRIIFSLIGFVILSSCSWLGIEDNSSDYLSSQETQVTVVPENLDSSSLGQLYPIPKLAQKLVADTTGEDFTSPDLNQKMKGQIKSKIEEKGDFWHNLEWQPGGQQLYRYVKSSSPYILSAYAKWDKNCKDGKMSWIKRHLMMPKQRINLVKREDKKLYAVQDGVPNILIDDYIKNIMSKC